MTEEIVREAHLNRLDYVTADELNDDLEKERITNDIIDAISDKKVTTIDISVNTTALVIPNLPDYGAFILCVQGEEASMPTHIYACCSDGANATAASLVTLVGSNQWVGNTVTVGTSSGNFTISHDKVGVAARFFITVLGYF